MSSIEKQFSVCFQIYCKETVWDDLLSLRFFIVPLYSQAHGFNGKISSVFLKHQFIFENHLKEK